MTVDYIGAVTELQMSVNAAIDFYSVGILGYKPFVQWPGYDTGVIPDASKFWGRFSTKIVATNQAALSNNPRRYENFGLVFFQWFAPKSANSEEVISKLCLMIQTQLRAGTNSVILRNVRIQEAAPENGAVRKNVVAEFEFDENSDSNSVPEITVLPQTSSLDGGTFN